MSTGQIYTKMLNDSSRFQPTHMCYCLQSEEKRWCVIIASKALSVPKTIPQSWTCLGTFAVKRRARPLCTQIVALVVARHLPRCSISLSLLPSARKSCVAAPCRSEWGEYGMSPKPNAWHAERKTRRYEAALKQKKPACYQVPPSFSPMPTSMTLHSYA